MTFPHVEIDTDINTSGDCGEVTVVKLLFTGKIYSDYWFSSIVQSDFVLVFLSACG